MTTSRGVNVSRRMLSPGTSGVQDEIHDLQTSQSTPLFLRAVVVRVIPDPSSLDAQSLTSLKSLISNPEHLDKAPRNSLIVRIVSGGFDRRGGLPLVCYPFLPPHICVPVKTAEQVWVQYEVPDAGGSLLYWMWRTSEPSHVDDLNYTHSDRKFDRGESTLSISQKMSSQSGKTPGFPNGGGNLNSLTLKGEKDYETIIAEDPEVTNLSLEAVPRFTKRPGDVVLQGSNNAMVVLGEDRPSSHSSGYRGKSGSIDLVVGRGVGQTAPTVVKNSRGHEEVDKNPEVRKGKSNPSEGDMDLETDMSRLLVTMRTDGDRNFDIPFPASLGAPVDPVDGRPYAVLKSDEVRIVSRESGSVRIVKEGDVGGNLCGLLLLPDGVTQLDGDVIYIGRGKGTASEPYIKFSKYKSHLETIIDELVSLLTNLLTSFAVPVAAPGVPHPGLNSSIPTITEKIVKLNALKAVIDEAKSSRIFGE